MLARVTNRARSARGFETLDHGTVLLEPGAVAMLDLADHPLHRAWEAEREVTIEPAAILASDGPAAEPRPGARRAGRSERKPA